MICHLKDDSRLFRNEREAGQLVEWIWSQGVEIAYCIGQSGDPSKNDDVWFGQRIGHLVADFNRRKNARIAFAHQEMNARSGYSNGGKPPYGYQRKEVEVTDDAGTRKTKVVFELNVKEAPAIRFAFEMYLNGRGGLQIADQLNHQGYNEGVILSLSLAFWIGSAARLPLLGPEYGTFRFGRRTQKVSKVEGFSNPETNG